MLILNKESRLATIVEVGENDVILNCADKDYIVHLTENNKNTIQKLMTDEGKFNIAFNPQRNELLLDVNTDWNEESIYELMEDGR